MMQVTYWNERDTMIPGPLAYVNDSFTRYRLNGMADETKLREIQLKVRELIHQPDATKGIEIVFESGSKYSSLVKLFNMCDREGVLAYINYIDKFWIFNLHPLAPWKRTPDPLPKMGICGTQ